VSKKPEPFNNPFANVKLPTRAEAEKAAAARAAPGKAQPTKAQPAKVAAPAAVPPSSKQRRADDEDAALFLSAIGEVASVRAGKQKVGPPPPRTVDQLAFKTEEAESLARLAELVSGDDFEVSDATGSIEGAVHGLDPNVLRKLRAGDFSLDASLDLHGRKRDDAKLALEQFISKGRVAGHRCVLVVTGRGLHSEDQVPVIKQGVQEWLTHGRTAKQVLAFCTAKPKDGGLGAVYVLLRR
jgi:DNA-nicking Smr family endonuclease